MESEKFQVVVCGKTGNGKSTFCDLLLGARRFRAYDGYEGQTTTAQAEEEQWRNFKLTVIDTPDFVNLKMAPAEVDAEIENWLAMAQPYAHAFLLTVRCDVRYTAEEFDVYLKLCDRLEDHMTGRLILVFTHAECLVSDVHTNVMKNRQLQRVFRDAKERYIIVSNQFDEGKMGEQREKLINYIREIEAYPVRGVRYNFYLNGLIVVCFTAAGVFLWLHYTSDTPPERSGAGRPNNCQNAYLYSGFSLLTLAVGLCWKRNHRKIKAFVRKLLPW